MVRQLARPFRNPLLWNRPISTLPHWGVILIIAVAVMFTPRMVTPDDWELSGAWLNEGVMIYQNHPDYLYPPWSLILFWPYAIAHTAGARFAFVMILGWLAYRCRWSLSQFFSIIFSPFFIFTIIFANVDLFCAVLPVLLLEWVSRPGWSAWSRWLIKMVEIGLFLSNPQVGLFIFVFWLWRHRDNWRDLIVPGILLALICIPISLAGSPPLIEQWLYWVRNPPPIIEWRWAGNNVSMTVRTGIVVAVVVIAASMAALYLLMRRRGKRWTTNHSYSALSVAAMLISPYASHQGVLVPMCFVPSWKAIALQYVVSLSAYVLNIYQYFFPWWLLLFGLTALWFFDPRWGTLEDSRPTETVPDPA